MNRKKITKTLTLLFAFALIIPLVNTASAQDDQNQQTKPPPVYDEKADANQQIAAALAKAAVNNKRVLIQWGANWCGWCTLLNNTFKEDKPVNKLISDEYELIHIDVARFDKHMDVAEKLGAKFKGIPHLTILDDRGGIIANLNTAILEEGPNHDPAKVLSFLELCKPKPLNADNVYNRALAQAKRENKKVFLRIGAPWCGWCHKLDDFLLIPEINQIITQDYILVKIDQDRMINGKEFAAKIRDNKPGGIPWFTILDADGKKLITSDGPDGNVGFPVQPNEIEHFINMFQQTATENTKPEQLEKLKAQLLKK